MLTELFVEIFYFPSGICKRHLVHKSTTGSLRDILQLCNRTHTCAVLVIYFSYRILAVDSVFHHCPHLLCHRVIREKHRPSARSIQIIPFPHFNPISPLFPWPPQRHHTQSWQRMPQPTDCSSVFPSPAVQPQSILFGRHSVYKPDGTQGNGSSSFRVSVTICRNASVAASSNLPLPF